MVKERNFSPHDLSRCVDRLKNDRIVLNLVKIATQMGYDVRIFSDVLKHDRQIDEYIHVSVDNGEGETILTYDGAALASYEPVYVHLMNGKIKEIEDWYDEIVKDVSGMTAALLSGNFVIENIKLNKGVYDSDHKYIEVQRTWKEKGKDYCIIQLLSVDDPSEFPKIGGEMTINA